MGEKKAKLLKDASLALAMTMSPKSGPTKKAGVQTKKMSNPQYNSSKFERTYQSLSSQKKVKGSQSNSSNCSKDKDKVSMVGKNGGGC